MDERYKSGMPLIVTTNLTRQELENPKDMRFSRIYDRVLEIEGIAADFIVPYSLHT